MYTYESVYGIVTHYILANLEVGTDALLPSHKLQEDLGLESIGLLSLAVEMENHFRIYLNEPFDNPPETIDDVVRLILQRLREKSDASNIIE